MKAPDLEFAFELVVRIEGGNIHEIGNTGKGLKKAVPIAGGNFEGPHIRGTIVPGGYDWQLVRHDGVTEIDARYLLKTADGALITIVNSGLRHGPTAVMERLAKGEETDPSHYYFRTIPVFETGDARYDWLNRHIFIANGVRKPTEVIIRVWKVL